MSASLDPVAIVAAMRRAKVSQRAIADRCGVSEPLVWQVVHGHRPNPRVRQAIAEACGVAVESLWPATPPAANAAA